MKPDSKFCSIFCTARQSPYKSPVSVGTLLCLPLGNSRAGCLCRAEVSLQKSITDPQLHCCLHYMHLKTPNSDILRLLCQTPPKYPHCQDISGGQNIHFVVRLLVFVYLIITFFFFHIMKRIFLYVCKVCAAFRQVINRFLSTLM